MENDFSKSLQCKCIVVCVNTTPNENGFKIIHLCIIYYLYNPECLQTMVKHGVRSLINWGYFSATKEFNRSRWKSTYSAKVYGADYVEVLKIHVLPSGKVNWQKVHSSTGQ